MREDNVYDILKTTLAALGVVFEGKGGIDIPQQGSHLQGILHFGGFFVLVPRAQADHWDFDMFHANMGVEFRIFNNEGAAPPPFWMKPAIGDNKRRGNETIDNIVREGIARLRTGGVVVPLRLWGIQQNLYFLIPSSLVGNEDPVGYIVKPNLNTGLMTISPFVKRTLLEDDSALKIEEGGDKMPNIFVKEAQEFDKAMLNGSLPSVIDLGAIFLSGGWAHTAPLLPDSGSLNNIEIFTQYGWDRGRQRVCRGMHIYHNPGIGGAFSHSSTRDTSSGLSYNESARGSTFRARALPYFTTDMRFVRI